MRTILAGSFLIGALASTAWADEPAPAQPTDGQAAPATTAAPADSTAPAGDTWRFKRHQDLWWYWLPTNSWVYWTGGHWVPYDAETYAKFKASRTRSYSGATQYSSSPQGYSGGNWGPVHYDQYGTRQYPYSRRTTGLQQLGPVPAMGGVRSLPGWGGER